MLRIVCHGGAGPRGPDYDKRNAVVRRAAQAGMKIMQKGGAAVDAATKAISIMEDAPLLNAGTGSYVQLDGIVRMDASIMDDALKVGAVIGISEVRNPIRVARRLMDLSFHSVLEGDLATEYARSEGFRPYDPRTDEKLMLWLNLRRKYLRADRRDMVENLRRAMPQEEALGTVGCVALDADHHIAAGTSTGGLKFDLPGRVGDVPMIGCGTYASEFGGVSCTGTGEYIIKVCLAKSIVDFMRNGHDAMQAARLGMEELGKIGGRAGLICVDPQGNIGHCLNTEGMTYCELSHE
ncbi:MAG: isoaspartyl peptidase/L-asparaginase [Candidatus Lernaella stagnicola]|nr:isoaspartyl peptidase/L-asparaginase [Candidatus Lernaella stagnicola]